MALIVSAKTFDRLLAGIRFGETDGPLLYVYAKDEDTAAEIEDNYSLHIATCRGEFRVGAPTTPVAIPN